MITNIILITRGTGDLLALAAKNFMATFLSTSIAVIRARQGISTLTSMGRLIATFLTITEILVITFRVCRAFTARCAFTAAGNRSRRTEAAGILITRLSGKRAGDFLGNTSSFITSFRRTLISIITRISIRCMNTAARGLTVIVRTNILIIATDGCSGHTDMIH